jgi:hypothetical protein
LVGELVGWWDNMMAAWKVFFLAVWSVDWKAFSLAYWMVV